MINEAVLEQTEAASSLTSVKVNILDLKMF